PNVDKLLLTPFALKATFEKLIEYFECDPALANVHLKQLFPNGLKCVANRSTLKKNHNQNNSSWVVEGCMIVDEFLNIPKISFASEESSIPSRITMIEGKV